MTWRDCGAKLTVQSIGKLSLWTIIKNNVFRFLANRRKKERTDVARRDLSQLDFALESDDAKLARDFPEMWQLFCGNLSEPDPVFNLFAAPANDDIASGEGESKQNRTIGEEKGADCDVKILIKAPNFPRDVSADPTSPAYKCMQCKFESAIAVKTALLNRASSEAICASRESQ